MKDDFEPHQPEASMQSFINTLTSLLLGLMLTGCAEVPDTNPPLKQPGETTTDVLVDGYPVSVTVQKTGPDTYEVQACEGRFIAFGGKHSATALQDRFRRGADQVLAQQSVIQQPLSLVSETVSARDSSVTRIYTTQNPGSVKKASPSEPVQSP
jgi:hypothetical protein